MIYLYSGREEGRKEIFYLATHSTHFKNAYMASEEEERKPAAAASRGTLSH